jgi:hypothetical protein
MGADTEIAVGDIHLPRLRRRLDGQAPRGVQWGWGEVSGDRLAQALHQERSELIIGLNGNRVNSEMVWQIIHRWDAMVEIARAARLIQAFDQAWRGNDWWEAHAKLYAALARLDSGAAE